MGVRKLVTDIYEVGAIDWNRRSFDELVPLHEGTSYNSYLIQGSSKTALIDTVDPKMTHELLNNLKELHVAHIDYIIAHHAEQDHSGSLPKLLEIYPEAVVVTNAKCKTFLMDLLLIPEDKFLVVADRQVLSLGNKSLEFILFPWVHWPETMVSYLKEDKILFSCDFFGSHIADTRLYITPDDEPYVYEGAFRYYAEIMYPFRDIIAGNMPKILELDMKTIAPSHGAVYSNPKFILDCYKEWTSPAVKNKVVIPYISMHGSTELMVNYLTDALVNRGVEVKLFQLSVTDIGRMAMEVTDAATVVVGTCMVLAGMHPATAYAVYFLNLMRPKVKFLSIIGSFGWGGKMVEHIQSMVSNIKAEVIPPVIVKGLPKEVDFKALDQLADSILENHKKLNLV